jgi:hypothetical protein
MKKQLSILTILITLLCIVFYNCSSNVGPVGPAGKDGEIINHYYTNDVLMTNKTISGEVQHDEVWVGNIYPAGNITVPQGKKLFILSNTVIYAPDMFILTVYGDIYFYGKQDNVIIITNLNPNTNWKSIELRNNGKFYGEYLNLYHGINNIVAFNSSTVTLINFVISDFNSIAISSSDNSTINLSYGTIRNGTNYGMQYMQNTSSTIYNCQIYNINHYALKSADNAQIYMRYSMVSNCGYGGAWPSLVLVQLTRNNIWDSDLINNNNLAFNSGSPTLNYVFRTFISENNGTSTYTISTNTDDTNAMQQYKGGIINQPATARKTSF